MYMSEETNQKVCLLLRLSDINKTGNFCANLDCHFSTWNRWNPSHLVVLIPFSNH